MVSKLAVSSLHRWDALIVGKVLLIADLFPVINAFGNKPLIYNTLWKSFLYTFAALALLFRIGEELVLLGIHHKSLAIGFENFVAETDWPHFWAIQIWVGGMLLVFVSARELIRAEGTEQTRRLFFGSKSTN